MRTRMYLDIHIISAPSMPTQGPTWYSCFFFERKRGDEGERKRCELLLFFLFSLFSFSKKKKKT